MSGAKQYAYSGKHAVAAGFGAGDAPGVPDAMAAGALMDFPTQDSARKAAPHWQMAVKRLIDVMMAAAGLFFLAPLMIFIALAIWVNDRGPIVFRQTRIGRGGQEFYCLKFRTMVVDADERLAHLLQTDPHAAAEWERDRKLRNDPRITAMGRFLRKTSLDELPQLINILRGDMSLVGPRPIVRAEVIKYGDAFTEYQRVRPGLTGLWQVSGRNDASYDERVRMDSEYVRTWSVAGDIRIVLLTFPALLGKGAY
jgi:Undecaprenyl-phosphate galactose phosphotransferase WbaP